MYFYSWGEKQKFPFFELIMRTQLFYITKKKDAIIENMKMSLKAKNSRTNIFIIPICLLPIALRIC